MASVEAAAANLTVKPTAAAPLEHGSPECTKDSRATRQALTRRNAPLAILALQPHRPFAAPTTSIHALRRRSFAAAPLQSCPLREATRHSNPASPGPANPMPDSTLQSVTALPRRTYPSPCLAGHHSPFRSCRALPLQSIPDSPSRDCHTHPMRNKPAPFLPRLTATHLYSAPLGDPCLSMSAKPFPTLRLRSTRYQAFTILPIQTNPVRCSTFLAGAAKPLHPQPIHRRPFRDTPARPDRCAPIPSCPVQSSPTLPAHRQPQLRIPALSTSLLFV